MSGCLAVVIASFRSHTRVNRGIDALKEGRCSQCLSLQPAQCRNCCRHRQTGIGLQFTESVVRYRADILVGIDISGHCCASTRMGLPATALIVLSVMTGPALQELGLALVPAHMIIFWLVRPQM